MQELDDITLLREYAERDSEAAFATLVARHIDRVYSVALRHVANPCQAEEITQAVFIILAKKSKTLRPGVILEGWLYKTTRLTALTYVRGEIRRTRREIEAHMQTMLNENEPDAWSQITPLLDSALAGLNETDRQAVVMRFFYGKSLKEIGAAVGGSGDTARMRINRAVEKMRKFFSKRGVVLSATVLTAAIAANSVQAAPTMLANSVTALAMTKGATAGASTLTLINGALKIMAWSKVKTAAVTVLAVLAVAAAVTPLVVNRYEARRLWMWQVQEPTPELLRKAMPQVTLVSTKFQGSRWVPDGPGFIGIAQPAKVVIGVAYGIWGTHVVENSPLPMGRYDFIANAPGDSQAAFQEVVKKQFGVVAHWETRPMDVLYLKVKNTDAPGLLDSSPTSAFSERQENGEYILTHGPINRLEGLFGFYFGKPVIDRTGLNGVYDFRLKVDWKKRDSAAMNQELLDQLGLELVPGRKPTEMLVVDKAPQ